MPGFGSSSPYQPLEEPISPDAVQIKGKKTCKERIHRPLVFSILVALSVICSSAPAGYGSGISSTMEKRFQLTNTILAAQPVFYDVVSFFTTIFVTHYGQARHRPRVIGTIQLMSGVGLLVNTIPHFLYPPPGFIVDPSGPDNSTNTTDDFMCHVDGEAADIIVPPGESGALLNEYAWFFVGTFFSSFSASVIPLAIPYVDDSVEKQSTAIYAGIIIGSYPLGSVLGYLLASVCLSVPTYPTLYDHPDYPKSPSASNWVGAWWVGYLFLGVMLLVLSPFFFCYPKRLPKQGKKGEVVHEAEEQSRSVQDQNSERGQQTEDHGDLKTGVKVYLHTLLRSVLRLLKNVPVVCLFCVGFLHLATTAGVQLFTALYIQFQFGLQAQTTSLLLGTIIIPSAFAGTMLGGYIIKKFGTTRVRIAWIQVIFTAVAFGFDPMSLFIGCPTGDIAGVTQPYNYTGAPPAQPFPEVNSTCNTDCHCKLEAYEPVCGEDGLTYITPCYAGCTVNVTLANNKTGYEDCSCIPGEGTATKGECRGFCKTEFQLYSAYGFLWATSITLMTVPGLMLLLRCVSDEDRSLAITLGNIISKIFGQIPAPLVFGAIIDGCCILHQIVSGGEGTCMMYNNDALRLSLNGTVLILHFLALILTIFAALVISIEDRDRKREREDSEASTPLTSVDETEDDPGSTDRHQAEIRT